MSYNKTGGAGIAAYRLHKSLNKYYYNQIESHWLDYETLIFNPSNIIKRITQKLKIELLYLKQKHLQYKLDTDEFSSLSGILNTVGKDYDIINLHWVAGFINYPKFFKTKIPIVWTLHDMNPFLGGFHYLLEEKDKLKNKKLIKFNKKILKKKINIINKSSIKKIICPSQWIANHSMNSLCFKHLNLSVIHNPIDPEIFNNYENSLAKKVFQLPLEIPTILFVASNINSNRKGLKTLLNALKLVSSEFQILLLGQNNYQELINDKRVFSTGFISDERLLSLAYSASELVVIPSTEDNLPNTMLEALSCGKPIISNNNGGMNEIIINDFNGYILIDNDHMELAKTIDHVISNLNKFNNTEIRNNAIALFNEKKIASEYLASYQSILLHDTKRLTT